MPRAGPWKRDRPQRNPRLPTFRSSTAVASNGERNGCWRRAKLTPRAAIHKFLFLRQFDRRTPSSYFSPSIGCKCNSNGWKFVGRGKRSMHPKKKWREGKIVTDCWILSDRCNRSFRFISDVWNARIFGRLAKKESIPMLPSDAPVPRINFTRNEFNLPRKHRVKAIAGSIINWFLFSLSLSLS